MKPVVVMGETFPVVEPGDTISLRHDNVSSLSITASATPPATLPAGTHYAMESAAHGLVKILNPGGFHQPFKASYLSGAQ